MLRPALTAWMREITIVRVLTFRNIIPTRSRKDTGAPDTRACSQRLKNLLSTRKTTRQTIIAMTMTTARMIVPVSASRGS